MDHGAIGRVLEVNFDSVADADAEESPRHLPIKGPVPERRAFSETSLELDREQIDAHGLRRRFADSGGIFTRFVRNIALGTVCAGGRGVTRNLPSMPASWWPG